MTRITREHVDNTSIADRMMAVLAMPELTHAERVVLAVIAWHDGPNTAYPSISTLCAEVGGMSPVRMRNLLRSLEKVRRRIKRQRRYQQSSIFTVAYGAPFTEHSETVHCRLSHEHSDSESMNTRIPIPITGSEQEQAMKGAINGKTIGWCRDCGHDHYGGSACLVCGGASAPFIVAPHECRSGVLTMPLGVVVSGLDTAEARRVFLSAEGQEQLQAAFGHVLEQSPLH